ncbi:MAG: hypothetical protein NTU97_03100 [Candidatus Magasanikbacteria bacterium]|nr:hypothetical protein [Candidatus Magasanikbacteria bacterium]
MSTDREFSNPLDLLETPVADKLKNLRDSNGLTDEDINSIALVLVGHNANCRVLLYEHQKDHHDIIDRLKELGLKVNREHINLQQYNLEHKTDLKTVLVISKK